MPDVLDAITVQQFGCQLRAGGMSALELTNECLDRIECDAGRLNAFIHVMTDSARSQAADADRDLASGRDRGPLHGVPVSVKDIVDVRGVPTTAASQVRSGYVAPGDARIVANLRRAGAVLVGKTNLDEFAFGTMSRDSAFGPVRNPHDPRRSPGGSSGGSAVSVAAGMALASIGTDTGGSIRIPAAACGIVGLKPTCGEISTEGVVPLSATLDHVGPFGRCIADVWLMYRALTGSMSIAPLEATPSARIRLGVVRRYFFDLLDGGVQTRIDDALDRLGSAGARMEEASIAGAPDTPTVYRHIHGPEGAAYHQEMLAASADRYTPTVRQRLETGRRVLAVDYLRALDAREELRRQVDAALEGRDALVLPTLPIPAPPIDADTVVIDRAERQIRAVMLRNTQLFNLTGHPAVSLPCSPVPGSLPCGLQLVGHRHQTEALLALALGCESVLRSANV